MISSHTCNDTNSSVSIFNPICSCIPLICEYFWLHFLRFILIQPLISLSAVYPNVFLSTKAQLKLTKKVEQKLTNVSKLGKNLTTKINGSKFLRVLPVSVTEIILIIYITPNKNPLKKILSTGLAFRYAYT